jgi:CTP-dependent riboflavin kinase
MKVRGMIFSGVLRGEPLIEMYYHRLAGIIGFEPFRGTLDIKLERDVDVRRFSTKSMDHILMDGSTKVYAWLAPVNLIAGKETEVKFPCWAMQQAGGIYEDNIIEILAHDYLKGKLGLNDRDIVEVEFFEPAKKETGGEKLVSRIKKAATRKKNGRK